MFLWTLWLACAAQASAQQPVPDLRFDAAEIAVSDAAAPPAAGWQPQPLPDAWRHSRPRHDGFAWYRLRFTLSELPAAPMALWVPQVSVTGEFSLNGSVLNQGVRFETPHGPIGTQMTNFQQLLPLPQGLFRVGENVLHVRVQGNPQTGGHLAALRLAPSAALQPGFAWRELPRRIVPRTLLVLTAAACVIGLLALRRRRPGLQGPFTLAMALWTLVIAHYLFPDMPVTRQAQVVGVGVLLIAFYWALLRLCWRFCGEPWPWYPRLLDACSAAMLAALLLLPLAGLHDLLRLVLLPTLVLRVLATAMLLQWAWRQRSGRAWALAGAELLWFAGHLQLLAVVAQWWPDPPFLLSPSVSLPLLLVLLYFFVQRLVFDHEREARARQALIDAERMRLLQDMHDGMGGHLVTALRLAQRDDVDRALVARSLEDALQDLRLIIDSLDVADQDLLSLLGSLRYRLQPRLELLGLTMHWDVHPLPPWPGLTPAAALSLLRVVQEALNNALRHAQASRLKVSVAPEQGGIVIAVADDGVGIAPAPGQPPGRGLAGMRRRAAVLGARLDIQPGADAGTVVRLWLPLGTGASS